MIALDSETTLATNEEPIPQLVSVAFWCADGGSVLAAHDPAWPRIVTEIYREGAVLAMAPFDAFVFMRARPELEPVIVEAYANDKVYDVLTREKMINIAEGMHMQRGKYNLGAVAERRAGIVVDKNDPWRLRYRELLGFEISQWPREAYDYAIKDAWATYETFRAQSDYTLPHAPEIARKHLALWAQTLRGIPTDPEQVARVEARLDKEIMDAEAQLIFAGLARFQGKKNPKLVCDTKAAQALMESYCRDTGQAVPRTATGISLAADEMNRVAMPKDHPLAAFRALKATRTLRTKTIPVLKAPRIRTRYDECKDTARTGSSAPQGKRKTHELTAEDWIGTNLQNQPQKGGFRECLVPEPGHLLVKSDFKGAELVTFAQNQIDLFGYSKMANVLRTGGDVHAQVACDFLGGIRLDQFDPENPAHVDMRGIGKKYNFGRLGGMGDKKFQQIVLRDIGEKLSELSPVVRDLVTNLDRIAEANTIWRARWDAQDYFDWVNSILTYMRFLDDGRRIEVRDMTHWRTGFTKGACTYTEACNFPFQHLATVAAGDALWLLWLAGRDPASSLYGRPTAQALFVHDENVSVVPRHRAEEARVLQEQIMIAAFARWCPDVPIGIDSKIMERYGK